MTAVAFDGLLIAASIITGIILIIAAMGAIFLYAHGARNQKDSYD